MKYVRIGGNMKIKLVTANVLFALFAPFIVGAQETPGATRISGALQETAGAVPGLIDTVINGIAQIANIFGNATGIRIGGTTGTAIVVLVIAKLLGNRIPTLLRWFLYVVGIVMLAGGSANVIQFFRGFTGG